MPKPQRILFLTLHTFSLTGGIEKMCRIFSKVLDHLVTEKITAYKSVKVLSLCDQPSDLNPAYCKPKNFKGFAYRRSKFSVAAILNGLKSHTIVLSHINLLAIAYFIRLLAPEKRIILFAHGIEVWRQLSPWKKRFLRRDVEIWAVSRFTANILQQKHRISDEKIKVLNNCLDPYFNLPKRFEKPRYLLERYRLTADQPIALTISRISSSELYKGYDLMIETMPQLIVDFPRLVYILAGKADQTEKRRLEALIKEKGLVNRVIFAGFIPDSELSDFFLLADIFVMPSKKEGFGIVFIEAAACGCKVIAGNQDGSRDALLDGELGSLIDPDDAEAPLNAIRSALNAERDLGVSLSQQQKCLLHFGYERYRTKVKELLDE